MTRAVLPGALAAALWLAAISTEAGETDLEDPAPSAATGQVVEGKTAAPPSPPWRSDPTVKLHPGSYLGGALGYAQARAWIPANDDHGELTMGPVHTWALAFRVGDAFAEWFALGFQIQILNGRNDTAQLSAFDLLIDATFYPWRGLGLRPSVGIGFGYGRGEHAWEAGGGGPGCLALGVLYEIRVTRLFTIAPVVQISWIAGETFDGLFFFAGIEFVKWFMTATG